MTLLRLGPDALRASRFALSPLAETLSRLITLRRELDGGQPGAAALALARWLRADRFTDGLLRLVSATKYLPDFVAIPPTSMTTRIEDELAAMRAVPDPEAHRTLALSRTFAWSAPPAGWPDGDGIGRRSADTFARGWAEFVAPDWSRRRAVMERDIRFRAGVIAVSGWRDAIDGLATKVRWVGPDAIQFSAQAHPDRIVGADGIVFVPHTGASGRWTCDAPSRLALVYPARGVLAEPPVEAPDLSRLIGAGRARILHELGQPASPTQLAVLLGVSLGTVSGHLAALRDAGAVVRRRSGRAVYYERTPWGDALS